jgi:hypothetical protein
MDGDGAARHPGGNVRGTGTQRPTANCFSRIEASKARLISSRNLCRNSDTLISESRATIARSLERLNSRPD